MPRSKPHAPGAMLPLSPMIFAFGEFELDVRLCVLRRGSEPVAVQPKVFDTLRYLIEHRDRVVTKAELLEVVWDGQRLSGVAVPWTIRHARRALGQAGVDRHPIETVRGRGYRFAATVTASRDVPGTEGARSVARPASMPPAEPFLGREAVMVPPRRSARSGAGGRGSLQLLLGEAGIGKTRCANELAGAARQAGVAVAVGRCTATEGAPALWPWVQILREVSEDGKLAGLSGEERSEVRAALDRLLPDAASSARIDAVAPPAMLGASRFWLSEAIARALKHVAKRRPRVLVIEDLHDADAGSVEALAFLAPDLARVGLLVVATSRDDAGGRLSRRVRPCEVIALSGLGLADVERYLEETTGRVASPDLARFVHDRTRGNPLFLKEAARMVVAQGTKAGLGLAGDVALPDVARELLNDRIATLGAETRAVLDAASAIGEEFELGVLARVVDIPGDALLACIDDALASRIVERRPRESFAFAHALLRDALYEGLPALARARLHRGIAGALKSRPAVDNRTRAIAYHLHRALPDADPEEVERLQSPRGRRRHARLRVRGRGGALSGRDLGAGAGERDRRPRDLRAADVGGVRGAPSGPGLRGSRVLRPGDRDRDPHGFRRPAREDGAQPPAHRVARHGARQPRARRGGARARDPPARAERRSRSRPTVCSRTSRRTRRASSGATS